MLSRRRAPWMCMSTKPGARNLPFASKTASPGSAAIVSPGPEIWAMQPSLTLRAPAGWIRSGRIRRAFLKSILVNAQFEVPVDAGQYAQEDTRKRMKSRVDRPLFNAPASKRFLKAVCHSIFDQTLLSSANIHQMRPATRPDSVRYSASRLSWRRSSKTKPLRSPTGRVVAASFLVRLRRS